MLGKILSPAALSFGGDLLSSTAGVKNEWANAKGERKCHSLLFISAVTAYIKPLAIPCLCLRGFSFVLPGIRNNGGGGEGGGGVKSNLYSPFVAADSASSDSNF